MQKRQEKLLQLIVENYLETAEPVGSSFLVEAEGLELSGATIRNEMRDLEEQGFLTHPHTSAGRIPTELGYKYYIKNIMKAVQPKRKVQEKIKGFFKQENNQDKRLKIIGKQVAEYMNNTVIVSLDKDSLYYTGISNLFSQAEFKDYEGAVNMSAMFDECEEKINDLYNTVQENEVKVLVGSENPLGEFCGSVAIKVGSCALFVVIGPMRMNYGQAIGLLNYISNYLKD